MILSDVRRPEDEITSPGAGIRDHESSDTAAGNRTQDLWKNNACS